jgi:hypothetical protein
MKIPRVAATLILAVSPVFAAAGRGQPIEIPFEFNWMARRIPAGARLRLILPLAR